MPQRMSLRIGVDCGGTNTDAVVLDGSDQVLGWAKRTTTEPDVLDGVRQALAAALRHAGRGKPLSALLACLSCGSFLRGYEER